MSLPTGFAVRIAPGVTARDGGRTLIGGAPLRVMQLRPQACKLLSGGAVVVCDGPSRTLAEHLLDSGMGEPIVAALPSIGTEQVTCVVPVRDRPVGLERLLRELAGNLRVIVVDDGSADPDSTRRVASSFGAQVVTLTDNCGPAGARNAGLHRVRTPYVLFADSDVVIDTSAVGRMLNHFHDPDVALVAPRVRGLGDPETAVGCYEGLRSSLDLGPTSALVRPHSAVSWVPAAVMLARVEALGDGFDDTMKVGEDVDLVWRLVDGGWRVRYDADVSAQHEHREALSSWFERKAFYGSGAALLALRHGTKVAPARLTPLGAGMILAAVAQRRWSIPAMFGMTALMAADITSKLGNSPRPGRLGSELVAKGLSANLSQGTQLLLRHWWPVTALALPFSRRVRRACLAAAVIDTIVEVRRVRPRRIGSFVLLRRLDDVAYGLGLWVGAARCRSTAALVPTIVRRTPNMPRAASAKTGTGSGSKNSHLGSGEIG